MTPRPGTTIDLAGAAGPRPRAPGRLQDPARGGRRRPGAARRRTASRTTRGPGSRPSRLADPLRTSPARPLADPLAGSPTRSAPHPLARSPARLADPLRTSPARPLARRSPTRSAPRPLARSPARRPAPHLARSSAETRTPTTTRDPRPGTRQAHPRRAGRAVGCPGFPRVALPGCPATRHPQPAHAARHPATPARPDPRTPSPAPAPAPAARGNQDTHHDPRDPPSGASASAPSPIRPGSWVSWFPTGGLPGRLESGHGILPVGGQMSPG